MNSKILGALAGVGVLAAGGVVLLSGDDMRARRNLKNIDGGPGVQIVRQITEAQVADRVVNTDVGKLVHVVGVPATENASVTDTNLGRAVTVTELPASAECEVVLEKREVTKEITDPRGKKTSVIGIDLDSKKYEGAAFIKIMGSLKDGTWIWNALLRGQQCKDIASEIGYLGSTMNELIALPDALKSRFLHTFGQCPGDGGTYRCEVKFGDPKATVGEEIFFPHHFSGRDDLRMMPVKNNEVTKRYEIPDGGFANQVEP